jgi:hypothetical protein
LEQVSFLKWMRYYNRFNKLQSQNVMKVEHATIKELQQKGTANFN